MTYTIQQHIITNTGRHLEILVEQDGQDPIVETFDWGLDVAVDDALRQTKALLDEKYVPVVPAEPELGAEGEDLTTVVNDL